MEQVPYKSTRVKLSMGEKVNYAVSKGGAWHLTHAMALNYIKYGIRVNSVSPGVVLSGIHDPVRYR